MFRTVHNMTTGQIEQFPVDDAWILANRPKNVALSIPQLNYTVGQEALISIQLKTPPLTNGQQNNLTDNLEIEMQFGDIVQKVNLVNGAFSDTIEFTSAGTFIFRCLSHPSNELSVTVV